MKHHVRNLAVAIAASAFLLSLSSPASGQEPVYERDYPANFDTLWTTLLTVLHQHGESMILTDKSNGLLGTDFKSEDGDKWHYKLNLLVTKKGDTQTNVSITCVVEKRSNSMWAVKRGRWEPKKSDGSHEKKLMEDIAQAVQPRQ